MKKKKVCIVSGTRADYGLLRKLISLLNDSDKYELQFIVTGAHLSKKFAKPIKRLKKMASLLITKLIYIYQTTPLLVLENQLRLESLDLVRHLRH